MTSETPTLSAPPIDGLVFDKDGTLFDFTLTWSRFCDRVIAEIGAGDGARAAGVAGALGYDPAERRFALDSPVIAATSLEVAAGVAPFAGLDAAATLRRLDVIARETPQVPASADLGATLRALRGRGLRLGVATNDTEAAAHAHLRAAGVEDLFDFVAGFDSGYGAKPGAGPLLAFARATGLAPGRVAMVGDSLHDMAAARAAGMRAVGVLSGPATRATLAPAADAVLGGVDDLARWLDAGAKSCKA